MDMSKCAKSVDMKCQIDMHHNNSQSFGLREQCSSSTQYLSQNLFLANHNGTDNNYLTQILITIVCLTNPEEQEGYIQALLLKQKDKHTDILCTLLGDRDILHIAIYIYQWPHMRTYKGADDLGLRHFTSWNPVMDGISNSMCLSTVTYLIPHPLISSS